MESGIVWFQSVERNSPLIMSAAPRQRDRATQATATLQSRRPRSRCPSSSGERDRPSVVAHRASPSAGDGGEQRAHRRRGVQQAEDGRATRPDAICGKSAIGIPKNIALMSTRYEPSRSRGWRHSAGRRARLEDSRPLRPARRHGTHERQRHGRHQKRGNVHAVGHGEPDCGNEDARDRRAEYLAEIASQ